MRARNRRRRDARRTRIPCLHAAAPHGARRAPAVSTGTKGESRFCSSGSARGERSKRSGDGEAGSRPPVSGPGEIWKRPALGGPACYCGPVWRG